MLQRFRQRFFFSDGEREQSFIKEAREMGIHIAITINIATLWTMH